VIGPPNKVINQTSLRVTKSPEEVMSRLVMRVE
jgi:hypothetical protein